MEHITRVNDIVKHFRETRLNNLRPASEFFNHRQLSRPADLNQATERISYNTRYFAGNYGILIAMLAVYALITNVWLLFAIGFLFGGFTAINRFVTEPIEIAGSVVTPKGLYMSLFVIGIPLLWFAAPLSTLFWIVGASLFCILFHASLLEPGLESEYSNIQDTV
ncbi:hypothetical protein BS47DRAFT_1286171 [Hydnum rufescens UP504]|uniref:PRA1 family protein n=1 Tax=Hydnum rufescens UP504 TaxID=1448309 RepID=A0A9P6BAX6_9AGAM|nr:hypothetical protein BS47DRAFT_1286171 [Hydnum rufescens UP504]